MVAQVHIELVDILSNFSWHTYSHDTMGKNRICMILRSKLTSIVPMILSKNDG